MFCFGKLLRELQNFHSHPRRLIPNPQANGTERGLVGVTESWSCHSWAWRRLGYTYVSSFLNWWINKYHTRLHHSISAEILALYFGEKSVLKRERRSNEEPGDGKLAHYQEHPCFSGAVFKYCCALCHCFKKAIMLSSLRWHQRQRAPTMYYASTTASLLFMRVEEW